MTARRFLFALLVSLALLCSATSQAQTTHRATSPRQTTVTLGAIGLEVSWLAGWIGTLWWTGGCGGSTAVGFTSCERGPSGFAAPFMAIPIAGPWIAIPSFAGESVLFPIGMGLLQLASAAIVLGGIVGFDGEVAVTPGSLELRGRF